MEGLMTPQLSADTEILKVLARYKASADKIESAHDWSDAKRDAAVDRMDRAFAKVIGLPVNTAEAAVAAIDFLCTAHRYGELSAFPAEVESLLEALRRYIEGGHS